MINCNLKCDSYYTCCIEFNKSNSDEEYEDGYVNEDDDDENFYLPYINSIKDLNEPREKLYKQCEQLPINGDSINFNMDIFKSYITPFLAKPSFKIGNQVTMKNVHARYLGKRFSIEDCITQSKNFKTFYDHLRSMKDAAIAKINDTFYITTPKFTN